MEKNQNSLGTWNLYTDFVWENRIFVWEKSKNCLGELKCCLGELKNCLAEKNLLATGKLDRKIIEKLSGRIEKLSVRKKIAGHQ